MIIQNGVGITALLNGETVKQTLNAANETVAKGIYVDTTLSTVDGDLATANIKNGITLFGFAGDADVWDISDATAIAAEVIDGETFYAVSGGIRTGTMPIQTLDPANENVAAGYYAGTTLSAVDAQLAAANILSGITIFGFTGPATVQDIADADAALADVKNGKTFYSATGGRKTGNLATVALAAGANAYPAGYHVGAANLTAVDGDLVAGNIADGVVIFGVTGNLVAGALAEDILGYGVTTHVADQVGGGDYYEVVALAGEDSEVCATKTQNYDADSIAVGVGFVSGMANTGLKLQLYMAGVLVAETATLAGNNTWMIMGFRALSGSQTCLIQLHAYAGNSWLYSFNAGFNITPMGIGIGSVKLA